jgi:filamentous hemagglutinin family protein
MNANCFKTVFSERLGCLIAVGEHACSQGKSSGEYSFGGAAFVASVLASASVFIGALVLSQVFVGLAWAQPAANALPTGAAVVQGAASLAQSANQLHITQSTQRAAINWQSFDIGAAAKVNVVQPNAQAVLLNRVVGQSPSQIFGKLQANGHVILVNPNGVLFGKDGSVNAGSFTASTLGITDANFMAGNMVYERNGSTAGVVNQGTIQVAPGGYVALLGASVSNEGKIIAPQGGVALGSAATVRVPVSGSGRVKLELKVADINASVSNTGQIVSQGGQVYMQALALNQAAAQVIQSGSIDTSGEQGGAVHVLADGGTIKVDGSITSNSTGTDDKGQLRKGGDIVIGRDEETGVLARYTNVSSAKLESQRGFIETSGDHLRTEGVSVKAAQWLLDPSDIIISSAADSNVSGTSPADITPSGGDGSTSVVNFSTIQSAINAGTSVTIKTTNASNPSGAGNITIANALAFNNQGASDATLSLVADNGITQNAGASITTNAASTRRVHISLTANGNHQGNTAASASSQGVELRSTINTNGAVTISGTNKNTGAGAGVQFSNGASITTSLGSAITVNGTATSGTAVGVGLNNTLLNAGSGGDVNITGTSFGNHGIYNHFSGSGAFNMRLVGRNVSLNGTSSGVNTSGFFSYIGQSAGNNITASGDIAVMGTANGSGTGSGLFFATTNWQTYVDSYTAGGAITFRGTNTASANTATAIRFFGMQAKTTGAGSIAVEASTQNAGTNAIALISAGNIVGFGYQGGATSLVSSSGDVKLQANQGGISFNDGVPNSVTPTTISGRNISIDNTGGTIDTNTGAITRGTGSGSSGISISDGRAFTATGNISLYGAGTSGNGVAINGAATLSASNINITGENTNTTAGNAGINMSNAASSLAASSGVTLTSGGTGSGTSLVAAGNISVGTQLRITTPAAGSIAGVISGTGSLLKMGAGETRLTAFNGTTFGTNTFSGGTTISQGSLLLGNGNGNYNHTAGTGAITLGDANTGTRDVGLWIDEGTNSGQVSLARNITVSNNGTGIATIGAVNGTGTGWSIITGTIDLQRNVTFADTTNDRLALDGPITGTGNITIAGTGSGGGPRVSMGSAKTFTGDVTINAGVQLQASAANLFNSSTNVQANGTFNLNSTNQAINSLNGASTGQVTNGGTLTIGSNNGGGAFAGVIANNSRLIKNGTGTQILSGNNTYTGGTQVAAGTLQIGDGTNNGLIGPGAVDIATGATLTFNVNTTSVNYGNNNTFTGGGTFRKTGTAGLTWGMGIATFSLGAGSLIDVQQGTLTGAANANDIWTNNRSSLNVAGGAIFAGVEGNIMVDALTGAGTITSGFAGYAYGLTVGVNGGSGTFSGSIQNSHSQNANLTKIGAGTQTLSGANTLTGVTTVNAGTLALGNVNALQSSTLDTGATGPQQVTFTAAGTNTYNIGALQGADNLAIGANSISAGGNNASTTYSGALSGSGNFTKVGTGTTTFLGNNTYDGTTSISGGTLQIGNGGTTGTLGAGAVTLSNNALLSYVRAADTSISNNISGTGSVSASITGAGSDLTVSNAIALTGGTANLAADGHLSVTQGISTTNATANALVMNAGKATNAGTASGGDIQFSGSGSVGVGTGGRATLFTGSLAGSTGLGIATGNNRYNSDEQSTNYTAALSGGIYAIYREAPTLSVRFNDASKTYDAQAFTGGNGLSVVSGFIKGDSTSTFSSINYSGTAQNAINAGTYAISGTALNSQGYALSYTSGTLTVNKADLVLTGSREYDAGTTFGGQYLSAAGVAGQTFSISGAGDSSNLVSKHVAGNQSVVLNSVTGLTLGTSSNGGVANNYNAISSTGSVVSLTTKAASVSATGTHVTYNGNTQQQPYTSTIISGDVITVSGLASGTNAGSYTSALSVAGADAGNYHFSLTNADLVIDKANLTLSGSRAYDAGTTFAGQHLTATGVSNEAFAVSGSGDVSNLSSKHVQTNQLLSSVAGLIVGASTGGNAGLSSNYNDLSTAGSSVSVTPRTLTVTGTNTSVTYNGSAQTNAGATIVGKQGSDDFTVGGYGSGTNASTTSYADNLSVTGVGNTLLSNYDVHYTQGGLSIGKANLVLSGSRQYDAGTTFAGQHLTATGVAGQTFTVMGAGDASNLANQNVQSNQALSSITGLALGSSANGGLVDNYNNISTTGSSVSVTPRTLTVTGVNTFVTYNGSAQTNAGATIVGKQGSDDFTVGGYGSGTNASTTSYADNLSVTGVGNTLLSNYDVHYTQGGLSIGKANLVLSGSRQYDASTTFAGQYLTATGVAGETFSVLGLGDASNLLSKNVADNQGVSLNAATGLNLGMSTNGGLAANYNALSATGSTVQVSTKVLSAAAAVADKVYDGNQFAVLGDLSGSGVVAGDRVIFQATSALFSDKNVSRNAAGQVLDKNVTVSGLSLSGADAGNYALSVNSFTTQAKITPRQLTLQTAVQDKMYDGTRAATGHVLWSGVLGADTLDVSWGDVNFVSKDVARSATGQVLAKSVVFSNLQLSGHDLGNYSLPTAPLVALARITPKELNIDGTSVVDKPQDGNTDAKTQVGRLTGLVGAEQLEVQAMANFDSAMAGSSKPVTVRYRLGDGANGGLGGNYELPDQVLRANIFAQAGGNSVQPIKPPVDGPLVSADAATATVVQTESRDVCSSATPEKCQCHATSVAGMEICMPGLKNMLPSPPPRGRTFVEASGF